MHRLVSIFFAAFLWVLGGVPASGWLASTAQAAENPFRLDALGTKVPSGMDGMLDVTIVVPPGHHVYRDMISVRVVDAAGLKIGEPSFPRGLDKPDPANPALSREMYDLNVVVELTVGAAKALGAHPVVLEVGYQGCKGGLCFMPVTEQIVVPVDIVAAAGAAKKSGQLVTSHGIALVSAGGGGPTVPVVDFSGLPASADVQAKDAEGKLHPVRARLTLDSDGVRAGDTVRLGVHLKQKAGWHTYWRSPGDIGLPTTIAWTVPDGATTTSFEFPTPERFDVQTIISYGYDDQVLFFTDLTLPADLAPGVHTVSARADWLVCEVMCIPGGADLSLPITVAAADAPAPTPALAAPLFDHFAARHPTPALAVAGVGVEMALTASAVHSEESFKAAFLLTPTDGQTLAWATSAGTWPAFTPIAAGNFMVMDTKIAPVDGGGLLVVVEGETFETFPEDPLPSSDVIGGLFQLEVGDKRVATELVMEIPWVAIGAPVTPSESPLWKLAEGATAVAAVGGPQPEGEGPQGAPASTTPVDGGGAGGPLGFAGMLGMAFIGGAILNIMPCVLPVLTLKLYSLVEQKDVGDAVRRSAGLAYTAGIVVSFLLLALVVVVARGTFDMQLGWGFQFQYPAYVAVLATIVFVFGLSLFGVFEVPTPGANQAATASSKEGLMGYFLTGVFTTLLATPCSAPFLGTGMGFAFGLPSWGIGLFFGVAGLGLASPFLIIAFVPFMMRFMPRPGAWMETFKHLMGFTLMATTIWLLDVLGAQIGIDGLVRFVLFLLAVGVGSWIFGHWGGPTESGGRQLTSFAIGSVFAGLVGWQVIDLAFAEPDCDPDAGASVSAGNLDFAEGIPWQPFTEERVASFSGKSTVFIDFTADWCLTCKVNERTVLSTSSVKDSMATLGVVPLKADWTRRDEAITRWLQRFGKAGVPFYLVVPADPSKDPIPLPEVITPATVVEAMQRAAG
jgi:thiol:disulfide interchange protein/DsbC/DsbD-like thiol-disulfide interchange protein